jgi:hypothetical protein
LLQFEFNESSDSVYARVSDEPGYDIHEIDELRVLEYDVHGELVGIEFLQVGVGVDLSDLPYPDELARFFIDHHICVFE